MSTHLRDAQVSVDVGGTFTDVVLFQPADNTTLTTKVPSTPENPALAVMRGIEKIANQAGIGVEAISYVVVGTTVATNALLERKGARTALVTTAGFRDVFEIGNQRRPDLYNFWSSRPKPPVPRHLVFEVRERVMAGGNVDLALDEPQAIDVLRAIGDKSVTSVAVCFLHSYANPINEQAMKRLIMRHLPGVHVSVSSEVQPEIREYERISTTAVNAYLMPKVEGYIVDLTQRLKSAGVRAKLHIMQSNGGLMSADAAASRCVHTAVSGPAGGVLAGVQMSQTLDEPDLITLDMGGTSTDVALIEAGSPKLTSEGTVGGFPIRVPMLEIHTIGTGGGSIAWVDGGRTLRLGPSSAGADPGPACYGRGGEHATTTDADLVLGRLNPSYFLGGEASLDVARAETEIERIAEQLGISMIECAHGIVRLAVSQMAGGVNVISTQRGYDLRDFSLIAFGGAGPVHAAELAEELGLRRVIVPLSPANFSAIGGQIADVRYDYVRTVMRMTSMFDDDAYHRVFSEMAAAALSELREEGFEAADVTLSGSADIRYEGQAWELSVRVRTASTGPGAVDEAVAAFHALHRKTYGYSLETRAVSFVNLRLSATGKTPAYEFQPIERIDAVGAAGWANALKGHRAVFLGDDFAIVPVYERIVIERGASTAGPAIVEEYASTTVVLPSQRAAVDAYGNIIIEPSR